MLVFKKNIYDRSELNSPGWSRSPDPDYDAWFDPKDLITSALEDEGEVLDFIGRQPAEFWRQDTEKFYPYADKMGGRRVLQNLHEILQEGQQCEQNWYHMNTYHFCYLYDVLVRFSFNYNHDNQEERIRMLPNLRGKNLHLDLFIKNYFFNTVFLLDEEKYNALSPQEKKKMGYDCPCQFGVINGLTPTRDEMKLKQSRDYPYSIYV